ncbi:MAG: ATP-dependent Clp protease ATP-binding subunit, partial [Eubacteriales bacterium]
LMQPKMCTKCKKNIAVVFLTKMENGVTMNEGYCLKCARSLGIPQIDEAVKQMGISEDDLDLISDEMSSMFGQITPGEDSDDDDMDSQTATFPLLNQLFGGSSNNMPMPPVPGKEQMEEEKPGKDKKKKNKKHKFLDSYCMDLTGRAKEGKLDAVIGRDVETQRVMQILTRRQKNNPCLIGEPGVGKTAIAEALAQRIAKGEVPYKLRDKEVFLVDLTALVAGTQFRGQFESRMKGLVDEVKALGNIILVIDEVHSIVGVGDSEGSMNAANILKPSLSRGEIQIIGATTLTEYRKYIEKDAALERRFQPIIVEEPSIEDTKKILEGIKNYYETYHKIRIPAGVINAAVELSERYITDRFLPDKAIDLLDEAAAYVAMNSPVVERVAMVEKQLDEYKKQAAELEETATQNGTEQDDSAREETYAKLAEVKAGQLRSEEEYAKLRDELASVELTTESLARVIEIWTGVPAGSITANEFERLNGLSARLKARIKGQDAAVDAVVRAIKRNRAGVSYKRKPVSFIFAGPTGVGKTELVKVLAADLFNTPDSLIRMDMSEFMEKHSVSRLVGSPPGYVGYDDAGQLTEKIRRKPYSVVLFDEIEKAHPDVLNILLQILDDGKVTDSHGKEVKFDNCVIVMTTNAGSSGGMNTAGFGMKSEQIAEAKTEKALAEFLRPEFLNRVDEIITFRSLDKADFEHIASIMLGDTKKALSERGIDLMWTPAVEKYIAEKSFSEKYGARNMRRFISREIEDAAAEKIIAEYDKHISVITIDSDGEKLDIETR